MLALCQRAKIISLAIFILAIPISIAVMQAGIVLLGLAYVVEAVLTKSFRFPATPLNRPLFAYIAVTILVSFFSISLGRNLDEFRSICVRVAAFYLVYLFLQERAQVQRCVNLLIGAITLAAIYGIAQHYLEVEFLRLGKPLALISHVENDLTLPVRISGFSFYMTFSEQLAMTLPIILALLAAVKTTPQRVLLSAAGLLTFLALLWTYTRSSWLGAACALLLLGCLRGRKFALVLIPLVLIGLVSLLQPDIRNRMFSMFRSEENLERLYTWESTLYMIKDHPLIGIGKRNYSKVAPVYRLPYGDFEFTSDGHAHNNILQVMVEGGILSLLSFLWLWAVMFRELYRTYQQMSAQESLLKWLALGFLCALTAFFIQGFFEHNWGDSESVTMMWLIMALALKLPKLNSVGNSAEHAARELSSP